MTVRWYTQPPTRYTSTAIMTMTPNTPPGPNVCVDWCTPPQANGDRPSKKYMHSSTAATKDMLVLANGSLSQRSEMTVFLRRMLFSSLSLPLSLSLSEEGFFFFLSRSSSSSSSGSWMISRGVLGRVMGERFDFGFDGHKEPPV
jgi:hypothetical protein